MTGRGRHGQACAPSIVPLSNLPGYVQRSQPTPTVRISVPTCAATLADTLPIAAGPFIFGGAGDPPTPLVKDYPDLAKEQQITLPAFRIDRTEVTNAAFAVFAGQPAVGVAMPAYPTTHGVEHGGDPDHPVGGITWMEAREYCRYLGKELPTTEQWERVLRGALVLADGGANPHPRRSLPWGDPIEPVPAKVEGVGYDGTAAVGSYPLDRSPDGVLDLAGNVSEWTSSLTPDLTAGFRVTRGGNWGETNAKNLLEYVGVMNQRGVGQRWLTLGVRCVVEP
ncbi:MAG: SUMF1/EgtB/PvdO family nonheme iron enzyme [Deltaproteobacteria bacterium]|nr:SUMF1/EgtB/PvdO family nonheme iron enzyme [Deltaproteobacteria bacterium]